MTFIAGWRRRRPWRGQSLNEFFLERMSDFARAPTLMEFAARIGRRGAYDGPSSADILRRDRDTR
jgi:hypothetical protein